MSDTAAITTDFLIRGSDYMAQHPEFELVGREQDLRRLSKALTRKNANSVILTGRGGVGCSTLSLGMQARKSNPDASYDIISKRHFWLDTDGLFESGDPGEINKAFQRTLKTLSRSPDTILHIDDMRDFIDGARNNGCSNLINALMRAIKQKKFQAIFEADDDDLEVVLKAHSDMQESYTLIDVNEPEGEELERILKQAAKGLSSHHKIKISEEAIAAAMDLTTKYRVRDLGLSRAQPERGVTLLDRAMTSYRLDSHAQDPRLAALELQLNSVTEHLGDENYSEERGGMSVAELETRKAALESDILEVSTEWKERQNKIKRVYKDLRDAEEGLRDLEEQLESQHRKEAERRAELVAAGELPEGDEDGEQLVSEKDRAQARLSQLSNNMSRGNFGSREVNSLRDQIRQMESLAAQSKKEFETLTEDLNDGLELTKEHVLNEFSAISGVPVSKLTQNEKAKLKNLETNLGGRVWGQDLAVHKLANEVLIAKAGLQSPDKPQGAFLYLGPSGVGKTELAKALGAELLDDEKALLRFDMSEYMEKHAVAKLIGAPPGYEGYEAGGILTNEMRRNPRRIVLLDEIEKAHPDILLLLLQVLDDARLTDNRGLTVSFRDAFIIMTSNVGKEYFVDPNLTFEQAQELAIADLEKNLPPELLNRLNGRQNIVCFDKLNLDVIAKIATRDLGKLNKMVKANNAELSIDMKAEEIAQMCADHYVPVQGARGIVGYIQSEVKPEIARTVLFEEEAAGVMDIDYDSEKGVTVNPPRKAEQPEEEKVARPTAAFDKPQPV